MANGQITILTIQFSPSTLGSGVQTLLSFHCWLQGRNSGQTWTTSQVDPHPHPGLIFSSFPQRHPGKAGLPVFPSCSFSYSHSFALQMLSE